MRKRIPSHTFLCCVALFLGLVDFAVSIRGAQAQVRLSSVEEISAEFKNVPCKDKERLPAARAMFERMGAKEENFVAQKRSGVSNLVLTQPGDTDETVIIGAHYDYIEKGCGAVDNWSGIVAVAHAYRTVSTMPKKKTVLFAAFDREESGLLGSKAMVNAIPKAELPRYCAMINIDSFGLALPFALRQSSSESLMTLSQQVSAMLQIPFYTVTIPRADSDSSSFMSKKIPSVTLSGLSSNWETILHTDKDQKEIVNGTSVYLGYRLAVSLWEQIDRAPCDTFRGKTSAAK